jgi:type I restriction enzyme S subunit
VTHISLGKVVDVTAGQAAPPPGVFDEEGTPFIRAGSVQGLLNGKGWSELERLGEKTARKYGMKLFPADTVIFAKSGMSAALGRVFKLDRPAYVVSHLAALRPIGRYDQNFLACWLKHYGTHKLIKDPAYPSIRLADISDLLVPDLPLPEQKRLAAILGQADELQRRRRMASQTHDRLGLSFFLAMFGDPATNPREWPRAPLRNFATIFSDGPFGSNLKSTHYVPSGIRVVRLQNIGVGRFIDNDKAFISEEHFARLKKHKCLPGDVLVGTLGDPNLRACIQPDTIQVALNKADCVQIRVNQNVATPEFLCTLLNIPATEKMAHRLVLGQTRARISMGRLRDLVVPMPPLEQQQRFSQGIASLRSSRKLLLSAEAETEALFTSLQQRAFRGEL